MRQQIFEPFYTTPADRGGSGLGLATVRSIVDNHGGLLRLDSVPGKGSTFRLISQLSSRPPSRPIVTTNRNGPGA